MASATATPTPAPGGRALIRRFAGYYAPYKKLFALDFGCAVLSGLLELAFPIAVQQFIDSLLPSGDWGKIIGASVALAVIYFVNTGFMVVVNYWGHMLGINIETEMRRRAFDHLQRLSFRFFDNNKTGHLIGRVTRDLEDIGEVAHHGPEDVFIAVMTLIGAFWLMFAIHPPLAWITAVIVPLVMVVTTRYGARMTRTWRDMFSRVGDFNARIENNVSGMRVVQAFANEDYERDLFAVDNRNYRSTKLYAYKLMAASMSLNYLSMRFTQLIVMVCGTYYVINDDITNGQFVAFLLLVNVFFRPIEKLNAVLEIYPKGLAGFRRYVELIDEIPDIQDRLGAVDAGDLRGDIRFEDVSFGYSTHRNVLNNVNLDIKAGETIAFVGPSGAGKTTISSLLPRFYDVTGGRITIDGMDIRDMTLASLRREIGIVQQDVFLFNGTIRENIAYGDLQANEEAITEAAARARLDTVIADLPEGLDTIIGERGVKMSGGQKQRLSIARMFLKNPPILILDEATSALDTATEQAIQRSLNDLSVGRTTLVIAHRLATIRNADRIVVVTEDGIVEQGSHRELLEIGGVYKRLHDAQYQEELT
ncbi:MAG: ABC transporter ATP-binding protein/permease [Thermomicrobiales bacterium]|nr:ABC transporter ATP-binding protein/permease [Thermomicrobiales bacterium]